MFGCHHKEPRFTFSAFSHVGGRERLELWLRTQQLKAPLGWISHHNNIIYAFHSLYQAQREAEQLCRGCIYFILGVNRHVEILGICTIFAKVNYRISALVVRLPQPKRSKTGCLEGSKFNPQRLARRQGRRTFPVRRFYTGNVPLVPRGTLARRLATAHKCR